MSKYRFVRWKREHDNVHGVAGEPARKYTKIAFIENSGVTLAEVDNDEADHWFHTMNDMKLKKAAKNLLAVGKRIGITKAAKTFLKEAAR